MPINSGLIHRSTLQLSVDTFVETTGPQQHISIQGDQGNIQRTREKESIGKDSA